MRVAFVLSGGGAKGDFEVGALRYLYDQVLPGLGKEQPDIICGTSVGAVNSVKLAEGGRQALEQLERIWTETLNDPNDMYLTEPWYNDIVIRLQPLTDKIKGDMIFSIASSVLGAPISLLGALDLIFLALTLDEIKGLVEGAKNSVSAFNLKPMEAKLRDPKNLNPVAVAQSGILLRLAVVGLQSGELGYVTERGELLMPGRQPQAINLVDGVLASASEPGIFPPVQLPDDYYTDGGVREISPVRVALELGADQLFIVVASKAEVNRKNFGPDFPLTTFNIVLRTVEDLLTNEVQESELNPPRGWDRPVTIIQPTVELHDTLTVDPGLISISMDYGWLRAFDTVQAPQFQSNELSSLRRYSDRIVELRKQIWYLEHQFFPGLVFPDGSVPSEPLTFHLQEIRNLKRDLFQLVIARRQFFSPESVPANALWWAKWERHAQYNWAPGPIIPSPWDEFRAINGEILPAEPPPGQTYTLTLVSNPPEGGRVDGGGIYTPGTQTSLRAYPNAGWAFRRWTEDNREVSTDPYAFLVTMDRDHTYVAIFERSDVPTNTTRATALDISVGYNAEFNSANAPLQDGEPPISDCGGNGDPRIGKTIWFRFTPIASGRYGIIAETRTFDVVVAVYRDTQLIGCAWAAYSGIEGEPVTGAGGWFAMDAGSPYYIRLGGSWGESGIVRLSVRQ